MKKEEDQNLKNKFKKDKQKFEEECRKKINIANHYMKELKMNRTFKAIHDNNCNMKCLVEEKELNSSDTRKFEIELKAFVAEYNALVKVYNVFKN